jgi:hypothetical protein
MLQYLLGYRAFWLMYFLDFLSPSIQIPEQHLKLHHESFFLKRLHFYYILIELQMDFTWWQWHYKKAQHKNTHITQNNTPQNIAHRATQTIKDKLYLMNTIQRSKAIPVTGRGGL